MAEVHVRTLQRAAQIAGGEQQLALHLKVVPSHLGLWLSGAAEPPIDVFLLAVDLVTEHDLSGLSSSAQAESDKATPQAPAYVKLAPKKSADTT